MSDFIERTIELAQKNVEPSPQDERESIDLINLVEFFDHSVILKPS